MPGSVVAAFSEPEQLQAALQEGGNVQLMVTGPGQFRARLTHLALLRGYLLAGEEWLARIALISRPAISVLVVLPAEGGRPQSWGGSMLQPGELITVGPGERLPWRTEGPCRWRLMYLPAADLLHYGRALVGPGFANLDGVHRWRPARTLLRPLSRLYDSAIGVAETRLVAPTMPRAAHGLDQELTHSLIACLSAQPAEPDNPARQRHVAIVSRFDDILQNNQAQPPTMSQICQKIGISVRTLQSSCKEQLGMGPSRYSFLRRMQWVRRSLRAGDRTTRSVSQLARLHGFKDMGRFAAAYRELFGELPSATLPQAGNSEWTSRIR